MYIDIILFAVLAAVLATNLYKILGKKAISEDVNNREKNDNIEEDKQIFSNDIMDYSRKQIINLDKDFSFTVFLEGAKSAFTLIVNAYKNKKIQDVKELLSSNVYDNFKESIINLNDKEEEIIDRWFRELCANVVVDGDFGGPLEGMATGNIDIETIKRDNK